MFASHPLGKPSTSDYQGKMGRYIAWTALTKQDDPANHAMARLGQHQPRGWKSLSQFEPKNTTAIATHIKPRATFPLAILGLRAMKDGTSRCSLNGFTAASAVGATEQRL